MNKPKYQDIEEHILELIATRTIGPGDRLPSLRELKRQTRSSIATVTRAYEELERKQIIESRPRSGYFVLDHVQELPPPPAPPRPDLASRPATRNQLIREVLKGVGNKDLIPLSIICPDERLLPTAALHRCLGRVCRDHPHSAVAYEQVEGNAGLRKQICLHAMEAGIAVHPDEILVTTGAMEALSIAIRSLTAPGDNVLIQSPTYFCFLQLLENCGLRTVEIPSHPEHGVNPADLRRAVDRFDITACILAPNYNNPDGGQTPEAAQREIVDILARRQVPLIEDDVAGDLFFGSRRPHCYKAADAEGLVLSCGSFSKTLSPGYRVGWLMPGRFLAKAYEIKATSNISSATPTQMAVADYLRSGHFDRHLRRLRQALSRQMQSVQWAVGRYFPAGTRMTHPRGGSVLWVELPGDIDAVDFFARAVANGISIAPGPIFSTQDNFSHFIRLSCGGVWDATIEHGLQRLGDLARAAQ